MVLDGKSELLCLLGRDDRMDISAVIAACPFVVGTMPGVGILGASAVWFSAYLCALADCSLGDKIQCQDLLANAVDAAVCLHADSFLLRGVVMS